MGNYAGGIGNKCEKPVNRPKIQLDLPTPRFSELRSAAGAFVCTGTNCTTVWLAINEGGSSAEFETNVMTSIL